jgi:hypothetical protein
MERIYHTWDKWECFPAGFYGDECKTPMSKRLAEEAYRDFLGDSDKFRYALVRVLAEWPNSCEHYLSNDRMNRIAWLGQATACIALGVPSCYRGGFNLLPPEKQEEANAVALVALNEWLKSRGEQELTMEEARSKTQMDLY